MQYKIREDYLTVVKNVVTYIFYNNHYTKYFEQVEV